jgi:outer membrane biosynthesis protein TonB
MPVPDWIILAEIDADIIGWLVVAVFVAGGAIVRAIGNAVGNKQKINQRQQSVEREVTGNEDGVFEADPNAIQNYLSNLSRQRPQQQAGVQPVQPPQQPARPVRAVAPPPPPPIPQPRPQPRRVAPPKPEPEYRFGTAEPLPKPAPAAQRVQARKPPTTARQAQQAKAARGPKEHKAATTVRSAETRSPEERLEFAQLSPLQRAVVLREVLDRRRGPHRFLGA